MKIAITGSKGFIGSAATRYAEAFGHTVVPFDHPNDILGDLSTLDGADSVIHLAGMLGTSELFYDVDMAIDVNIKGAVRILQWCRENGAGYVGISMPPVFPSVYTVTKICADSFAKIWHENFGIPVSRVVAYNAYGPGQKHGPGHPQKILPTFAVEAWAGRPIPVWGDGTQTVDLVHADDVGRILIEATNFGHLQTFDAGTGIPVRVIDLANEILDITGSKAGIEFLPMRQGEIPLPRLAANGRGWDKLGWKPRLSHDRIAETVEWYKDHPLVRS